MENNALKTEITPQTNPRRIVNFFMDQYDLIHVLNGMLEIRGWPDDAMILSIHLDHIRRLILISVWSSTFEEVPVGQFPPEKGNIGIKSRRVVIAGGPAIKDQELIVVNDKAQEIVEESGKIRFREYL